MMSDDFPPYDWPQSQETGPGPADSLTAVPRLSDLRLQTGHHNCAAVREAYPNTEARPV